MTLVSQEDMIKLEDEEIKAEVVIKQEEEEIMESRKRKLSENTPRHPNILKKCCVCGEMNKKYQMTIAPKWKSVLKKWAQVFGPEFLEACRKDTANHFICSIHWDQIRDDWEGPLPEVLEKMKKKNNGSFKDVMLSNNIDKEDGYFQAERKAECRYCGAKCYSKDMTGVTTNEKQLMEWTRRLGQQFLENVRMNSCNKICWSHFMYRNEKHRHADNLPMTDEMMNRNLTNDKLIVKNVKPDMVIKQEEPRSFVKCRYCDDFRDMKEMVLVPDDGLKLAKWVKNLGSSFYKKLTIGSTNYICWNHFNLPYYMKPFYLECLPKDTHLMKSQMEAERLAYEIIKKESEIEGDDLVVKNVKPVSFIKQEEPVSSVKCRYCDDVRDMKEMVLVPENRLNLARWVSELGSTFSNNLVSNSTNYICWSHFNLTDLLKPFYIHYLPQAKSTKSEIRITNKQEVDKKDVGMMEDKLVVKNVKPEMVIKQEESVSYVKCRYCDVVRDMKEMVLVPEVRLKLAKWVKNLGSSFYKKLTIDSTNYICWNHFNLPYYMKPFYLECLPKDTHLMKSQMDSNIEHEEKLPYEIIKKESEIEGDEFEKCRYCCKTRETSELLLLPQDPLKLARWVGTMFFKHLKNESTNYICFDHLNYANFLESSSMQSPQAEATLLQNESAILNVNDIKNEETLTEIVKVEVQEQLEDNDVICRYCGAKCNATDMTKVPENKVHLWIWTQVLGQQFYENVRKHNDNHICSRHFKNRDAKERNAYELPIANGMMNSKTENCRYCGCLKERCEMMLVPEDPLTLFRWVEKLGSKFFNNLTEDSENYICSDHLDSTNE